jgi:hypothetical protein
MLVMARDTTGTVSPGTTAGTRGAVNNNPDRNIKVAINVAKEGQVTMSDDELTPEEVEEQEGEELPDREAMSLINGNVAAPINAAVALNALSDHSTAAATATQDAPITQGN